MPSKKHDTVWEAAPHTIAKINILQSYLDAYFQILGRTFVGSNILYIDGFAGPGEYLNLPNGSPVAALKAAVSARRNAGTLWESGAIYLAFIEADTKRCEHLREVLAHNIELLGAASGEVKVLVVQGEFSEKIGEVKKWCPHAFGTREPLFAFVDPFGTRGVPFGVVRDLLNSPCSELLFNLDADGIARILKAQSSANHEVILDEIFGNAGRGWRDVLDATRPMEELCRDVLALYKERLREVLKLKYVFSFEMRTSDASPNYFLVFASKHPLGLEKMKEAMRRIDQDGSYTFVDTNAASGQGRLFRFDHPEDFARTCFEAFKAQKVGYETLRDWALNESPFVNPKAVLVNLENNGHIRTHVKPGEKRRKGSFPEDKIQFVEFSTEWQILFKPEK